MHLVTIILGQIAPNYVVQACRLWQLLDQGLGPTRHHRNSNLEDKQSLSNRAPRHRNENSALHRLDERYCFVNRLRPPLNAPRLLTADLALLQVGKLPQMVDGVEITNLDEPCTHALHDLPARLEASTPMRFPLKEIAGVEGVRSKLEQSTEATWRGCRPERKLLHKGCLLTLDQGSEFLVKLRELWVARNGIQGLVVSRIALIFPDMDCERKSKVVSLPIQLVRG